MQHFGKTPTVRATFWATTLCATLALAAPHARADTRYATETQMGGSGQETSGSDKSAAQTPTLRTTTFVKGKRERQETVMAMGAFTSNTVTLTQCDARQVITMDPDLKLYTITAMDGGAAAADNSAAPTGEARPAREKPEKSDTGRVVTTYAIQDLGTEKVGDIAARHFLVNLRIERSGCAGKGDNTMKMETWVAPGQMGGLDCEERIPSSVPRTLRNDKGCRISFETRGDTGLIKDVFSGIVVRQRLYNGDKVVMTQEVKDIASTPLDAALFAPPPDYKQVSPQEFADAQRKAQMSRLTAAASSSASNNAATSGAPSGSATDNSAGSTPPPAQPAPTQPAPKRRGGLLGGLGGALGGALGRSVPGVGGNLGGLSNLGGGVLSALGGPRGLGGLAGMLGSGTLGGFGGFSPVSLPGSAGQTLSLLGSLTSPQTR